MIHNAPTIDAPRSRTLRTRSLCVSWYIVHAVLVCVGLGHVRDALHAAELRAPVAASFRIQAGNSGGSGTAIAEHLVVTNAHVVGDVRDGVRVFQPLTGLEHVGRVLATNEAADVALIHIPDAVLPCVPVSPTGPQIGSPAHMIGYGGDAVMKVGSGEFSSNEAERSPGIAVWYCNVQSISGDSGGGIFNDVGELVAINWGSSPGRGNASASTASPHILQVCLEAAQHYRVEPTQCFGRSFGRCQPPPGGNGGSGGGYGVQPKIPVQPFAPLVDVPPITQPPIAQPPIAQPPIVQPPITQPPVAQPPIAQPPAVVGCGGKCADGIAEDLAKLAIQLALMRSEQITRADVLAITIEQQNKLRVEITEDVRRRIGPTPAYFEIRKRGQ